MTQKEIVKKAIHFENPPYIPLVYYSDDDELTQKSDLLVLSVETMFGGENGRTSEWGFEWEDDVVFEFALGQTKTPAIFDWRGLSSYELPDPKAKGRFDAALSAMDTYKDKYCVANFILSGFTIMLFIRGFENLMMDFCLEQDNVERLADMVFSTEEKLIYECAKAGFDAIGLADDWGTQRSLLISKDMFRKTFLPRYRHQIQYAHSLGLDVFLHSCGYIYEIIPDLIDAGLDILNPGQPSLNGIQNLGESFAGKICFACPTSYQTTAINGSKEEIEAEIADYVRYLSTKHGGFYGMVNCRLWQYGVSDERQKYIIEMWEKYCGENAKIHF